MDKLTYYKRRYDRAQAVAQQWWAILEAAYHYCVPSRNLYYYTNQTQGSQKNIKVYDTTQVHATKRFVSKIQMALTPPQQIWAYEEAAEALPDDDQAEINKQLRKRTEQIFGYLRQSNFDVVMTECYYDLAVGTAVLVANEGFDDEDPLLFSSIPLAQVAIEESINHRIESCYRTWGEVRIMDIQTLWPNAKLTSTMKQMLNDDPGATVKNLIEANIYTPGKKVPYTYILWSGNDILLEEDVESSSYIIFRWSKINNEIFGRGPIIDALPSILSLQTLAYFEYTSANFNVSKPFMGWSDGVFNPYTFKLEPNTIIPVAPSANGQFPIAPFPDSANPQFFQLTASDLRDQINKLMYAEGLPEQGPVRTATEVALTQQNLIQEIGPLFTRLQQEFLSKVIKRVTYILEKKGLIDKIEYKGKNIKLRYKSPLTISQGQQDVQLLLQYQQIVQSMLGPENAIPYLDTMNVPWWIAMQMGVNPELVNTPAEMQKMFQDRQKQAQMMQQAELANAG